MTITRSAVEANFDGLVGPTHNYAGLSLGNVASVHHAKLRSFPKAAALQGLTKMKALFDMGLVQGVLAPHDRPDIQTLKQLGFSGTDNQIIEMAFKKAPDILAACYSASSMWTANAATISPSPDTTDGKVHITPANLNSKFHRSIEPKTTQRILKATFVDENHFSHHDLLPACSHFGDEGAANHTRLCTDYSQSGLEIFVYGRKAFDESAAGPKKFPARQTLEASQAVARLHNIRPHQVVFAQQNPEVIDKGVFHNDVISVGNENVLLYHEEAFLDSIQLVDQLSAFFKQSAFYPILVPSNEVTVEDAVQSYLFNSQIVSLSEGEMAIIAPEECKNNDRVWSFLQNVIQVNNPIKYVKIFDVKESMQNGGGPACLRLRVAMNENEIAGVNQNTLLSSSLYDRLVKWVNHHYRDHLDPNDLSDPHLMLESRAALDELTQILNLGSVYPFQRVNTH
ncbi:MAG: N-succinylarginine dihydrolase [Bdellovibrionales bacterium]|nr:N-succinylarginine dihydrolase [Bdellovibrionales bacterium]